MSESKQTRRDVIDVELQKPKQSLSLQNTGKRNSATR